MSRTILIKLTEYLLASTDKLIRFWRSKVAVTAACRGGSGAVASTSTLWRRNLSCSCHNFCVFDVFLVHLDASSGVLWEQTWSLVSLFQVGNERLYRIVHSSLRGSTEERLILWTVLLTACIWCCLFSPIVILSTVPTVLFVITVKHVIYFLFAFVHILCYWLICMMLLSPPFILHKQP